MALALISLFQPSSRAMILGESMVAAGTRRRRAVGRRGGSGAAAARVRRAAALLFVFRTSRVSGPSRRVGRGASSQREPWLASGRWSAQQLWRAADCGG